MKQRKPVRHYPKLIPDEEPTASAHQVDEEPTASAHQADVDFCLRNNKGALNAWEFDFLLGISGYASLSDPQAAKLKIIKQKVKTGLKYRGKR